MPVTDGSWMVRANLVFAISLVGFDKRPSFANSRLDGTDCRELTVKRPCGGQPGSLRIRGQIVGRRASPAATCGAWIYGSHAEHRHEHSSTMEMVLYLSTHGVTIARSSRSRFPNGPRSSRS